MTILATKRGFRALLFVKLSIHIYIISFYEHILNLFIVAYIQHFYEKIFSCIAMKIYIPDPPFKHLTYITYILSK